MAKPAVFAAGDDTWVDEECADCAFKDARLNLRFLALLKSIAGTIGGSIPFVCQDWANPKAAYRFLSNSRVTEADILTDHFHATRDRFAEFDALVLVLHDTTEFSYQRENTQAVGITKMTNNGRDKAGRLRTTATQKYTTSPCITPQQLRHPTCSSLQFGTGAMFCVRSDDVGR